MSDVSVARASVSAAVAEYKGVLRAVLDNRPSGTRQRLATALGKNRSFVSQIANPAYPVPIPAQHVQAIFEVCHFSTGERKAFLAAYGRAHPGRLESIARFSRMREVAIEVPDLHDDHKNALLDEMLSDVARRLARLIEDLSH
jgi:hypothetical protein